MTQIWLTTTQGEQIYTHGIWQVEDVNLTEKSEGVLNDTKWLTISFTIWLGGNFLQLEDVTLPENLGGVLKHKIHFSINYGQQLFTRKWCNFNWELQRCLT